jgi:hypothetical protein
MEWCSACVSKYIEREPMKSDKDKHLDKMKQYLTQAFMKDCLQDTSLIALLPKFVESLDDLARQMPMTAKIQKPLEDKFESIIGELKVVSDDMTWDPIHIDVVTVRAGKKGELSFRKEAGTIQIDFQEGASGDSAAIAAVAAAIMQVVEDYSPMPSDGRVEFSMKGRVVRFGGDIDEQTSIDLAYRLLGKDQK